jgi:hypothetical protein
MTNWRDGTGRGVDDANQNVTHSLTQIWIREILTEGCGNAEST